MASTTPVSVGVAWSWRSSSGTAICVRPVASVDTASAPTMAPLLLLRSLPSTIWSVATALSLAQRGSLMRGVRSVDQVGAEERAAALAKRSIKKSSKLWALDLAIRCIDLTTLEGNDTPGKVAALCAKGIRPKPGDASIPSVAAICVYPARVADCRADLGTSGVRIASAATAFPSGQSFVAVKINETRLAVEAGADEIDMVIDR